MIKTAALLIALALAFVGSPVRAASVDSLIVQEFLDSRPPKGAIEVPANELPTNLHGSAWRFGGNLYFMTPHPLSGTASAPSVIMTENGSGRSVSVFTGPVYFSESKFLVTP